MVMARLGYHHHQIIHPTLSYHRQMHYISYDTVLVKKGVSNTSVVFLSPLAGRH